LFAALLLFATVACAIYIGPHPGVTYVGMAPPPSRVELIPAAPGPRYVWIAGHWGWHVREYMWVPGSWVTIEVGYREYRPGRWQHDRHGWYWVDGRWW
jgi:hypothetical protein